MFAYIAQTLAKHFSGTSGMALLLTHGWLRGNLGDYAITLTLAESLKQLLPDCSISLISIPGLEKGPDRARLMRHVDRLIFQDYQTDNTRLFQKHDAVINIAGGGLQTPGDLRGPFMLRDAEICHRLGIKHCFSSHSFHPSFDLKKINGNLCVAREPDSFSLLHTTGLNTIPSADLAFLLKEPPRITQSSGQTLLFLRFDHFNQISLEGNILHADDQRIALPDDRPIVSSSDHERDYPKLKPFIEKHSLRYEKRLDLDSLRTLIASSGHVVSDRYHPIIFAQMAGVEWTFIERHGCLRDSGLRKLLQTKSSADLASMAQSGMEKLVEFLKT